MIKDSFIIGLIVCFCKKIFRIYNESRVDRVIKAICDFFREKSKSSVICGWFYNGFPNADYWRASRLYKIVAAPFGVFRLFARRFGDGLGKRIENSSFVGIINNFIYIPIREHGIILFSYSIAMVAAMFVKNEVTAGRLSISMTIIATAIVLSSAVMTQLTGTLHSAVTSSICMKPVKKLFGGLYNKYSVESGYEKDERVYNIASIKFFVVLSVLAGIISGALNPLYVLLPVVAVAVITLILYNTLCGVFISVFFAPILPTMACVALIALTAVSFIISVCRNKISGYIKTPMDFFVVAFLLLEVLATVTSCDVMASIPVLFINVLFIISYFLIVNTIKTKNQWYNLIITCIFAGFIISLVGIYQNFFMGATTAGWVDTDMFEDIGTRVFSTLDNPNVLGQYLVMIIPVTFAVMWSSKNTSDRVRIGVVVAAMLLCLVFTWSRAAWIGVIMAIAFYLLRKDRRWLAIGILAVIILPFVLPESVITRISSVGNMEDSSTAYRVSVWIASLGIAVDNILTGIGLGTGAFEQMYPRYALDGAGFALHSHNFYIQLVVEMGILGLILFLLIIFVAYKQIISVKEKNSLNKNIVLAMGGAFLGYLFEGAAENLWYNYRMHLMFWIYLAILQSGVNLSVSEESVIQDSIKE